MAVGATNPAVFIDSAGEIRFAGNVQWTTSTSQPGSVLPAVVSAAALPTADPHVAGQVWSDSGVLTVSAG